MSEINGLNLYMYCKDNPVMYVDPSGCLAIGLLFLFIIGANLGLALNVYKSGNEVITNIYATFISGVEIVAGVLLILSGLGLKYGIGFLGTGIGSITNGLITMQNGGSYYAGWAGGQVSGLISFIPYFGGAIGAFVGSALTDLFDNNFDFNQVDWKKAGASAGIAFALSWFSNAVSYGVEHSDLQLSIATQFILSYDYALLSICNSIINVFWKGKDQ